MCYQRTRDLYRELGDRFECAVNLHALGDIHRAAGDPSRARSAYEEALDVFDDLDHPDAKTVRAKLDDLTATG